MTITPKNQINEMRNTGYEYTAASETEVTKTNEQKPYPDIFNTNAVTFTQDEIDRDIHYHQAQKVAGEMLKRRLISLSEFNKLTQINRDTFSPYLVKIMPKIC